jgi:hypothetical protein
VEVLQWFIKAGDKIKAFDRICEVQSDKATVEISSRYDGKVTKVYHQVKAINAENRTFRSNLYIAPTSLKGGRHSQSRTSAYRYFTGRSRSSSRRRGTTTKRPLNRAAKNTDVSFDAAAIIARCSVFIATRIITE